MTHTATEVDRHTVRTPPLEPDLLYVMLEIDITSLDDAGVETSFNASDFHPNPDGVMTSGQADPQYLFTYDKTDGHIHVTQLDTAAAVTADTSVGVVDIILVGPDN